MGVLARLLGRSREKEQDQERCNECGMTGEAHTEWCPLVQPDDAVAPEGHGGGAGPGGPAGGRS